jgi:hypothetical protein
MMPIQREYGNANYTRTANDSKKEKERLRVFLGRIGFLLWRLFACILCRCILRLSQVALFSLMVLFPLPFCRGAFHDPDGVELSTK